MKSNCSYMLNRYIEQFKENTKLKEEIKKLKRRKWNKKSKYLKMEQKTKLKNECNKERDKDNPYEIWKTPDGSWEWRVLKKWQIDDDKPFARWMVAVKSPYTYGSFDIGDEYVKNIKEVGNKVK